jgi:NAD(P)-dependent dehydrogenase (short-subunit alcohol dehydrogenase family)
VDLMLAGRTVLVTGGSSGVGLATVRMLLDEGAAVVTCARRVEVLQDSMKAIGAPDDRLLAVACDVRDPEAVGGLLAAAEERFGGLDGLVNNAGESRMARLAEVSLADFRDEFELKFSGVLNTFTHALPLLVRSTAASVVNVNAVLAKQPEPRLVTTSAARAGLLNLTKTMALEYASQGIRVNSVCLGLIDTGQWRRRYEQSGSPLSFDEWSHALASDRAVALGRLGTADEVAAMIVMLLSPRASYVTASAIDVCGGVYRAV